MEGEAAQGNLRTRLIGAAERLLDEQGEAAVTLRALARETGVSAMAPYRHFADKAALLGAVAEAGFAQLAAVLEEADAQEDPRSALVAQGQAYFRFAQDRPALFRLMFGGKPVCEAPPQAHGDAFAVLFRRVSGMAAGDPQTAALAAWSTVHGLATLALDGKGPAGDEPVRAVLMLVAEGIVAGASF
ncbi:TetR/AcrR family transcriptional regulator [Novosphingobium beihaiensis]|uniref:TetR/AcrR family transcriptional regulator n=1 Tax=Novosphingobium beihaiensis TaxID=2930389 RepID=A0ABT0BSR6_9SPHN|nr:TetR/AcrR family transcriptional regulator [Novosphingobium beihaiensis]MCJ2188113.1 TetR/AcrR family transcriptional regulator [Novosphingobium beihaiensis]